MVHLNPVYAFKRPGELDGDARRHPVAIVGAGPVGLALAIDLARRGQPVVLLDDDNTVSVGSRAICYAKRTLEILDRLGCGDGVADRGVSWNVGRVYHGDQLAYQFDLLAEPGHRRPAFVNLQQYHLEEHLVDHVRRYPGVDVRWNQRVTGVTPRDQGVELQVETPDGGYALHCDWLVACDGARSAIRGAMGLETHGQVFRDRFLIADIHMTSAFPAERRFWFDPPFHPNHSVLLHRQPDNHWRVDFQLGWDADPDEERKPERILPRLRAMLGADAVFAIVWASVYTFACRRMERFRHGRVLFAGDAAHLVSPFGARGANSGIQDADNLGWKLALVVRGAAPDQLLDTFDSERMAAADENILQSTRSTEFITPATPQSAVLRQAVLELARRHPFARRLVNSGRLSVPAILRDSPLNTPDGETFSGEMVPGAPAVDAPVLGPDGVWFLDYLHEGFTLLVFRTGAAPDPALAAERDRLHSVLRRTQKACAIGVRIVDVGSAADAMATVIEDPTGLLAARYDGQSGTCYLFRPDQHVCARWRRFDVATVAAAIMRATANDMP